MASYNRVILAGNLTRDPELSYLPSNTAVCKFGLAVNRRYRDRDGNQKEEVCYVDLTAFGRTGEVINQYMSKGRQILVEGRLQYRQWQDKEGKNRSKLDVVVESFTFLGSGPGGTGGGPREGGPPAAARAPGRAPAAAAPVHDDEPPPMEDVPPGDEGDIPF
ncbi:MAG: hypothetical protein AMXMBFR13_32170 [Phycisphaerae bacterium]